MKNQDLNLSNWVTRHQNSDCCK